MIYEVLLVAPLAPVSIWKGLITKGRWFSEGLADAEAAAPFVYPDFTQESGRGEGASSRQGLQRHVLLMSPSIHQR